MRFFLPAVLSSVELTFTLVSEVTNGLQGLSIRLAVTDVLLAGTLSVKMVHR